MAFICKCFVLTMCCLLQVTHIVEGVIHAFIENLPDVTWMDSATKKKAKAKVSYLFSTHYQVDM